MSGFCLLLAVGLMASHPAWADRADSVPALEVAADTAVELRRGDRIVMRDLSGAVRVEATGGDRLEVTSTGRGDEVSLRHSDGRVMVTASRRGGVGRSIDVTLRVPAWADVELDGVALDVSVRGMTGSVTLGSVSGDLYIEGTSGPVRARTFQGEIVAESTTGPLWLSSHSDDVRVRGASGPVEVHSLSGDLHLDGSRSTNVRAETQAGDVTFSGDIIAGGSYRFFLHAGDARLQLPRNLSARIRVSTFHGTFQSDYPVMASGFTSGRPFEFTVGAGEAELRVEVFDGEIRLERGNR